MEGRVCGWVFATACADTIMPHTNVCVRVRACTRPQVRLLLTTLVSAVVSRADGPTLSAYGGDLCMFLLRAFEDGYHDIKKVAEDKRPCVLTVPKLQPRPRLACLTLSGSKVYQQWFR
jgi:hypothetical protein